MSFACASNCGATRSECQWAAEPNVQMKLVTFTATDLSCAAGQTIKSTDNMSYTASGCDFKDVFISSAPAWTLIDWVTRWALTLQPNHNWSMRYKSGKNISFESVKRWWSSSPFYSIDHCSLEHRFKIYIWQLRLESPIDQRQRHHSVKLNLYNMEINQKSYCSNV